MLKYLFDTNQELHRAYFLSSLLFDEISDITFSAHAEAVILLNVTLREPVLFFYVLLRFLTVKVMIF